MNGTQLHLQVSFRTLSKYWKRLQQGGSGATKHNGNEYDIGTDMIYLQPLDYYKNSRVKASWVGLNHCGITNKKTAKLLERSEVRIPVVAKNFSLLHNVQTGPEAHPASYAMGTGFFPGARRLESKVHHSPPYNAEIKNEWSHISTLPTCLHGMGRKNFT